MQWVDDQAFAAFLAVRLGMKPHTVETKLRRLRAARRCLGFDPAGFCASRDAADALGMAYLHRRSNTPGRNGKPIKEENYNQEVRWIKNLAEYAGFTVDFPERDAEDLDDPNPFSDEERMKILAWDHAKSPQRRLLTRGAINWFDVLGVRPEETTKVDVPDLKLLGRDDNWANI